MIFLVLSKKIMFLFPENMILDLRRKMKDDLSQKKLTKIWYFLQTFWKDSLFKKGHAGAWSFWYYLERWYFFPKTRYFFLGQEARDDRSQEMHGNMIFSVYLYGCYKRGFTYLCQKKSMMVLSRKIHLRWLTSWIDILERAPAILCIFMETFTGVFMFFTCTKKNRKRNM